MKRLFCFGLGYSAAALARRLRADGWLVAGTTRDTHKAAELRATGIEAHLFDGAAPVPRAALAGATHILTSIAPGRDGDPVLRHHANDLGAASWIGYLSTTGVYGDHAGAWVDETTPLRPQAERSQWRAAAEAAWQATGLPVHVFRLAGIYGPGRSHFDDLRAGTARRIVQTGHLFSRIHVEDIAAILTASMAHPAPGAVYNVCDDEPAASADVMLHAATLLGVPPPPAVPLAEARLSPMAASFWADNKKVRNDKVKRDLNLALRYPTYREGLAAILSGGG
jgi:nucleoside-diphosphate-sugar epimerase